MKYLLTILSFAFTLACSTSSNTQHVNVTVYDTVHVRIMKYDTIKITRYDTVRITKKDTTYQHTVIRDTQHIYINDTLRATFTKYDTITQTVKRNDTVRKTIIVYDTTYKYITDTVYKTFTKTDTVHKSITVTDTTRKQITVYDTAYKTFTKYDTLVKTTTIYDTLKKSVTIIDTVKKSITVYDTTHKYINDTVYKAIFASSNNGLQNLNGIGLTTGVLTQDKIDAFHGLLKWVRLRLSFSDFDNGNGYTYTLLDGAVNLCVSNKLELMFQIIRSPYDNMPAYLWNKPYSVPIVYTDDQRPYINKFPYYLNDSFNSRYDAFAIDLAKHIHNYALKQQAVTAYWMNSPLSTGDYVAYKGNIVKVTINGINQANPQSYNLTETQTTNYVRSTLSKLVSLNSQNTFLKIAANPDNTDRDLDYDVSVGILGLKRGELTHTIWNSGEGTLIKVNLDILKTYPNAYFFGENEGTIVSPAWTPQEMLPLVMQNLAAGTSSISFASSTKTLDTSYLLFNKYANDTTGGICYFKDVVDFNDTARFDTITYGKIIDPLRNTTYNNAVKQVNIGTMPPAQKQEQLSKLLVNYFNPTREAKIEAYMKPQGYQFAGDSQYHRMDGGIDLYNHGGAYEWRLHMSNFTGKGVHRLGDSTWAYGRSCLLINDADFDYAGKSINELAVTYFDDNSSFDVFFYTSGSA